MAWLQKRTDSTSRAALYSTSLGKTILLVGLGGGLGLHAARRWRAARKPPSDKGSP
jgi:hypothetical protein